MPFSLLMSYVTFLTGWLRIHSLTLALVPTCPASDLQIFILLTTYLPFAALGLREVLRSLTSCAHLTHFIHSQVLLLPVLWFSLNTALNNDEIVKIIIMGRISNVFKY